MLWLRMRDMFVKQVVLLIEDSRFVRAANQRALARSGFEVIAPEDGQVTVELTRTIGLMSSCSI
jgi:DNA-binding response OmpR family regulator